MTEISTFENNVCVCAYALSDMIMYVYFFYKKNRSNKQVPHSKIRFFTDEQEKKKHEGMKHVFDGRTVKHC